MGSKGIVGPSHPCVCIPDDNALPCIAHGPHLGRVYILHSPLNGARTTVRLDVAGSYWIIDRLEDLIGLNPPHIRTGGQICGKEPVASYSQRISNPIGLEMHVLLS